MRFSLEAVAEATGGRVVGAGGAAGLVVERAVVDSRRARPGDLFVAVVAARDGHDFVDEARGAGAVAHLASRPTGREPAVAVEDTVRALAALGGAARARLAGAAVVGVTGSAGKTTTKDLLAAVLGAWRPTSASEASHNNELGVPLTLVGADEGAGAVVVEMGARGPGQVAELCAIARPTVGVVTNVAAAHLATFGSLDGVAEAKGELVAALPPTGAAVLNADDPRVVAMAARTRARVWRFGAAGGPGAAEVAFGDVHLDDDLRARFRLSTPEGTAEVRLGLRGRHQVANAAAAATAALALGVDLATVVAGLAAAGPGAWRMELGRSPAGAVVLNDAYNANPASMEAALDALASVPARRRLAVVGPMLELGAEGAPAHRQVVAAARHRGIEVVAVGTGDYGPPGPNLRSCPDAAAALAALGDLDLGEGDAVLVKASRAAGLEALARALLGTATPVDPRRAGPGPAASGEAGGW